MDVELAAVIVMLALLLGLWLGRKSTSLFKPENPGTGLSNQYFQGLNYLLNEQPDKAIEVFIKMLEVDSETVETHLALGNLFRRRGETDRAILVHQNLIARPTLNQEQRAQALYELGLDYMRAGILSRAENVFLELLRDKSRNVKAMEGLVDIYQQEREWEKAIEIMNKYQSVTGRPQQPVISHYYCELAEAGLNSGVLDRARKHVKQALTTDKNSVRASLLEAKIEQRLGNEKMAIKALKKVEQQDALFLPEILGPLLQGYRRLGKQDEAVMYIEGLIDRYHNNSLALALVDVVAESGNKQHAIEVMTEQMKQQVSVGGLRKLIDLNLASSSGSARENLLILKDLSEKLLQNKPAYRCDQCGFEGKSIHWQCPTCKHWSSIKPIQEFAN